MSALADLASESTMQAVFTAALRAMSEPGTWQKPEVPAKPLHLALLSTLVDTQTTFADLDNLLSADERYLLLPRDCPAEQAQYLLADGRKPPTAGWTPNCGRLEDPQEGASILLVGGRPADTDPVDIRLRGPGIPNERHLEALPLHPEWLRAREAWVDFPIGVDLLLCAEPLLMCLPRSSKLEIA